MSQLEEQILKQNVLEEHRQVHELQVRLKELRGDITRYMMLNAEWREVMAKLVGVVEASTGIHGCNDLTKQARALLQTTGEKS